MTVRAAEVDSYAKVSRAFPAWLRRNFRGDRITREMAYHLVVSLNPVGVEFLPVAVLAGSIDATCAETDESLRRLEARGFLRYDHETEFVWVVEQSSWQVSCGNSKSQDAMVRRLIRPAVGVPNFWADFVAKHGTYLRLDSLGFDLLNSGGNSSAHSAGHSVTHSVSNSSPNCERPQEAGSRKQEQEQQDTFSAAPPGLAPLPPVEAKAKKPEPVNPEIGAIFDAWNETHGSRFSPKNKALAGNVRARLDEGHTVDEFRLVAEWVKRGDKRAAKLREDGYAVPSTAWAQSHFATYLELAKQWKAASTPHRYGSVAQVWVDDRPPIPDTPEERAITRKLMDEVGAKLKAAQTNYLLAEGAPR